ncbi:hypothetical protein B0I27_11641 [Arcticibacter pallidicorallinus]|uniref:Endosialidase-like protein n=2 Tax=Arcticibacter pallidicorallinus TaxID=1259464 RepID=A0A2T0TR31_9SPHI|nr:hypothetical protein B0I27_11641 [Arcticibacter pallidicorallinus]
MRMFHKLSILICALGIPLQLGAQTTWGVLNSRTDVRTDASLSGAQGAVSGFFEASEPVNYPAGASSWWHLLDVRHSNSANNFAMQFAGSFFDQSLYFRKTADNGSRPWSRVVLEAEGKVGINTTTPSASLDVQSKYDESNSTGLKMFYTGTWGSSQYASTFRFLDISSTEGGKILQANGYGVGVGVDPPLYASSDKLYVNGNVGIGTNNTQGYKLAVAGSIIAESIKVKVQSAWPDYVFSPQANLPSLKYVEGFISENRHLPEIPSAGLVQSEGIDVGEMNIKLLKKIEELTLYLIKQNKDIQHLKSSNQRLTEDVKMLKQHANSK